MQAILFYISILPQFISDDGHQTIQVAMFSPLFIITVNTWFSIWTFLFNYIKAIFQK